MMAAILAEGGAIIENAAASRSGQSGQLPDHLRRIPAFAAGPTPSRSRRRNGHGATHSIMPDRIETGTYLCGGSHRWTSPADQHLGRVSGVGDPAGRLRTFRRGDEISLKATPAEGGDIRTQAYRPSRPTLSRAQFMALLRRRKAYAGDPRTDLRTASCCAVELIRLGADIQDRRQQMRVMASPASTGRPSWPPTCASASLVIAGAPGGAGETLIGRIYALDRGYKERIEETDPPRRPVRRTPLTLFGQPASRARPGSGSADCAAPGGKKAARPRTA